LTPAIYKGILLRFWCVNRSNKQSNSGKGVFAMRYNYFIRSAVIYCAGICLSTAVFINTSAAQTIDEAKALFNAKNYTQAETILKAILKKNRNEPQANLYLGKIYRIQKQYDLAEQYLKKAVDKDKKLADGFYELGQIQLDKPRGLFGTKYKEAQNWFLKAVKADPKNADAKFALYETYFTLDESKKAFDVLSEYVKENPNSTRGLLELARLWKYCEYNMLRRLGTVHDIYLQAFATDPENPEDLFEIGWGLFLCDDLRNARLAHSRAEYVSKEITAEQYLDMMVVAFENLDYGTAYDYLTKAFAKLSGENRKLLTDPKRVPDFLLNELYNTYNIKVEQFLNPSYVPADQKLYIKQLYHFATLWTINHSGIERAKPLNYTGNHRFDTPYLLFGGLHNYLDYSFYYFLSSTEANEFLSIPNQYERAEWRHRWFREHDTSPTNDVNELEEEFMNRVNYVHEEFKILPNKYNKEWHANEQIGFDDRGKVWLKYGKPYHSYPDFGGFVDKETMDNPLLPQTKYTVTSGYKQVQVKPNESWVYPHLDGYLAFDFIEINVGYFTYSETLEDAVLGGTGAGRLYLNPLRVDLGGPYLVLYERYHDLLQKIDTRDESLWNLDETTYNEMITRGLGDKTKKFEFVQSDFLYDDLLPEIIKRNEVMEEYPTNLIDLGKPRFRLPMFVDMASFKGESGSTKIEVYTAVDYRNLSFAKESDKKRLAYLEYSVVVKDKDIMPVTRDTSFNQIVAEPKDLTRDNSWIN
jgi:GWxTD domain-containing protein